MPKKKAKKLDRKLRILWNSNAVFSPSGYGNQSRDLLYRFLKEGWSVAQSAFYGLEGGSIILDGLKIYPKLSDVWGGDAMILHGNDYKADITVSFQDSWVLDPKYLQKVRRYVPYVPVDHDPVPPAVLDRMKFAHRIVTYSAHGQKQLANNGYASTLIPHGVDMNVFKPMDKQEARKAFGLPPTGFLFGMVSANKDNPPRKSFQEALEAFARFKQDVPDASIYFHTIMDYPSGFPIKQYAAELGIESSIYFLDGYDVAVRFGHTDVAKLMNAFDCLLIPSTGEGFGMPCTEAQACGVPVIANDFTALSELVVPGETGYLVEVDRKRYSLMCSYAGIPSVEDLYKKMKLVYDGDRQAMGRAARTFVNAHFNIDMLVTKKWNRFFEELEEEIYATS